MAFQGPLKKYLRAIQSSKYERTNQLMVLTHKTNLEILEGIITKLDVNVEPKTKSKIFKVMHAEAKEVEALINQVISNQQSVRNQAARKSGSSTDLATHRPHPSQQLQTCYHS